LIRGAGERRFCEYYAAALRSVAAYAPYGDLLLSQARRYFQPKVSIIIPVYNGANYLAQAIDSALAQTYENTEVIVINDGSTDGGATERVARGFGERIRYIEKPNGGVATALNRGVAESSGDFVSWLSHDDLYVPGKLTAQVDELVQMPDPRRCVLYGDYAVFTDDPQAALPMALPPVEPPDFRYFITTQNILHGCTLLVPKQAFEEHGGFNPQLRTTQDYDLWFRMGATLRFVHQPLVLVYARSHADQGTLALSHLVLAECNALLGGFVERLSEAEVRQGADTTLAQCYFALEDNLVQRGFQGAGERAAELGLKHLSSDEGGLRQLIGQVMTERKRASELLAQRGALTADVTRLEAQVARLAAQCDGLQAQLGEHRRELEVIYGSRSWRLTVPLRYVSALLGRVRG